MLSKLKVLAYFVVMGVVLGIALISYAEEAQYYYVGDQRVPLQTSKNYRAFKVDVEGGAERIYSLARRVPSAVRAEQSPVLAKYKIILTRRSGPMSRMSLRTSLEQMPEVSRIVSEPPVYGVGSTDQVLINEFIVQFRNDVPVGEVEGQLKNAGAQIIERSDRIEGRYTVTFPGLDERQALTRSNELHERDATRFSQPNFIRLLPARPRPMPQSGRSGAAPPCPSSTNPNDTLFSCQWALNNRGSVGTADADINAIEAWSVSIGSSEIIIAIIDEGVDTKHPDLKDKIVTPYDATDRDDDQEPQAADAHGTASAGIAAAVTQNYRGIAGVAPTVKILPVRIARGDVIGGWITTDEIIEDGIRTAVDRGAHILSNSWGGGLPSNAVNDGIEYAISKGRVVIFAAGNENSSVDYPANLSASNIVIAVSATNEWDEFKTLASQDGEWWWGSNFGKQISVAAPGVHIYTTDISGPNGYDPTDYTPHFNGTSSATPHVAGVAALILSVKPGLSPADVRSIIQSTADDLGDPGFDEFFGHGRLNAGKAIKAARLAPLSVPTR